ncbi:aminotransferase class V-fold PLP-dependent enzyme [Bradyrhizobium liaoningense]|uniref:aminotransferase class V-fold PLP-dependent enzyme n=1 Tax=Bradyrhizobium liaoningense TaxID=43992 RepID=UPI001BABBAAC|nr:aminotransferase class V-fold PLP-dependent enzyme [Bradyrhizobium liaoningense]MBR0707990.1 aminotransferase class V-fold PLP-dependent enzyme [Bradyrhizobium liaoningense]
MRRSIYLDNQATTPTDPRVRAKMFEFLELDQVGNPHSEHFAGRRAATAVEDTRERVAGLIGAEPDEIIFTSGATEANNIAIQGITSRHQRSSRVGCRLHRRRAGDREYPRKSWGALSTGCDVHKVGRPGCSAAIRFHREPSVSSGPISITSTK